jgi:two-component system sensor histidine kinase BarA
MNSHYPSVEGMPLRRRLTLLIGLCAGLTAMLCMLAVVASGIWLHKDRAHEETVEVARMLSFALQAPVAFDDRKGIADALDLVRARPQVTSVAVLDSKGVVLATFGNGEALHADDAHAGDLLTSHLHVSEPILADGTLIGHVLLVNQLARLWQSLALALGAILLGSVVGLVVSVWLAHRIARRIAEPIATLARVSSEIALSQDYSQRLPSGGKDEIGTAMNAFNDMLDEIRVRGDALLEHKVADRTIALRQEKENAEAASVAKTRFLSNMSHELRTPLNAVIGAAQLLQDRSGVNDSEAHLVEAIRSSGTRLLGLIDNILDLSRIESGALDLVLEDFNLLDCVEAAVATAAVTARMKGLQMASIVAPQLAAWRHGDAMRLRQVLLNLLGNAVKFTLRGEVVLRLDPGATPDSVRIQVSDTGIGIRDSALNDIFEPFKQAEEGADRRFGGSGLGLAITRQLVQAMGGTIGVHSELGKGSCFNVELSLAAALHPVAPPPPLGHALVYFEPHEASAQALRAQLDRLGCSAFRCQTAAQLSGWLADHADDADKPWLLAALDADTTSDLLEASMDWLDPERVIGMTTAESHAADAARERFRVPRTVIKPVLRSALVSRLGAVSRVHDGGAVGAPADALPAPVRGVLSGKHVLVVEDDPLNQLIVCTMLQNAGCETTTADNGESALELLRASPFDLVLMDWQMPDMDGLEVTRRLRAGAAGRFGKAVPIVALTANAFTEDRAACLAAGMNDFLTKPVLAAGLQAMVARWASMPVARADRWARPLPVPRHG